MSMMKIKKLFKIFFTFFKIGLFTFGGGYAMIAIIERELVDRKRWISHEDFLDIIAIAESSPGPIAINSATFIGYKIGKFWGSFFGTFGVVLPSFIIIFTISFVFDKFLSLKFVDYAFYGIQSCVAFLIINAGIKMLFKLKKSYFNFFMCSFSFIALTLIKIFNLSFSTVYLIIIGGTIGIIFYFISFRKIKENKEIKQ